MMDVRIAERCPGEAPVVNTLGMNTQNYYWLTINKLPLPDRIVRYNNRLPLALNKANVEHTLSLIADQDFLTFYTDGVARTDPEVEEEIRQQKILKCGLLYLPKPRVLKAIKAGKITGLAIVRYLGSITMNVDGRMTEHEKIIVRLSKLS